MVTKKRTPPVIARPVGKTKMNPWFINIGNYRCDGDVDHSLKTNMFARVGREGSTVSTPLVEST
jgi:hypothetical protein